MIFEIKNTYRAAEYMRQNVFVRWQNAVQNGSTLDSYSTWVKAQLKYIVPLIVHGSYGDLYVDGDGYVVAGDYEGDEYKNIVWFDVDEWAVWDGEPARRARDEVDIVDIGYVDVTGPSGVREYVMPVRA